MLDTLFSGGHLDIISVTLNRVWGSDIRWYTLTELLVNGEDEVHRTPGAACFNPNLERNGLCELVSTDYLQKRSLIYIRYEVCKGLR